ncbi:hypothetical protein DRO97_10860, partial [Archaeoglobales archaeon]
MKPEELVGRKCYGVLHNSDKLCLDCLMLRTLKDKKSGVREIDSFNIGIPLLVSPFPIFADNGEVSAIIFTAKDLSEMRRAEKERYDALRRATEIVEAMADAVVILNFDRKIQQVNGEFEKHSGWKREEVIGRTIEELEMMSEEMRQRIASEIMPRLMKHGFVQNVELTLIRKDGTNFPALMSLSLLKGADGKPAGIITVIRDITEMKRVERALKVLSKVNQAIAQAKNEKELLNKACGISVEEGGYVFAWIGYTMEDKTVKPVAKAGINGYLDVIKVTWDESETGKGPTGTAIRTKKPSVMRAIATDPLFEPWREEALKKGYASSIALPLIYRDNVFGALNIYSDEKDAFDEKEVELLKELADNLAYGIAVIREIKEKERIEGLYRMVIENTGTAMLVVDEDTKIVFANNEVEKLYGLSNEKIVGRSFMEFVAEEDLDKVMGHHKLRRLDPDLAPRSYEAKFVDANGNVKHVLPTVAIIPGTKQSIISTIDVTELRKVERKMKENEGRYKAIFEKSPLAIVLTGFNMRIIDCNDTALKLIGKSREEIVGKKWMELGIFEEEYLLTIMESFYRGMGGETEITEIKINVGSKEKCIRVVQALLEKNEKPYAFLSMIEDITLEKISEKRLKETIEQLRLLRAIDAAITSGKSLDKILRKSLRKLKKMVRCDFACIVMPRESRMDVIAEPEIFKTIYTLLTDRKNTEALRIAREKGRVVRVDSILELENLFKVELELLKSGMRSYIFIPLLVRKEEIGLLFIASKGRISDENFKFIKETANQLAIALHEAILYDLKKRAYKQIEYNIEQFAILVDHIRNPLAAIMALAELEVENKETAEKIIKQVE